MAIRLSISLLAGLLGALSASASSAFTTLAPGSTMTTYGMFDPEAPTLTVEEIEEHQARRKKLLDERASDSDRRRQESERQARLCANVGSGATVQRNAQPVPSTSEATASRDDLRNVPLNELLVRFQRTQDPAALQELQRRTQPGAVAAQVPPAAGSKVLEQLAGTSGMDPRMADQLRLAGRANDPQVQACLDAAERIVTEQPEAPIVDFLDLDPGQTLPLRDGRTSSLVHDMPPLQPDISDGYKRFNVVMRAGPYGARAVPMGEAMSRARRPSQWPMPTVEEVTRSGKIEGMPSPLAEQRKKGSAGPALQILGDRLKGLSR